MPPKINSEAQSKYPTVSNEKKKSFKAINIEYEGMALCYIPEN